MLNFSRLEEAQDYEVYNWIQEEIVGLTDHQKECMRDNNMIHFSKFEFYKARPQEDKVKLGWRFTFPLFIVFWLTLFFSLPLAFLISGELGHNQKFIDKVYAPWANKLGINV